MYLVNLLNRTDNGCEYGPVTIKVRLLFQRTLYVVKGVNMIHYSPTVAMVADILTKPVTKIRMDKCVCFLFGVRKRMYCQSKLLLWVGSCIDLIS